MVGRAGRAGLCTSGEAFLIGDGDAHSLSGDWQLVCALLTAELPQISSQLIPRIGAFLPSQPALHTKLPHSASASHVSPTEAAPSSYAQQNSQPDTTLSITNPIQAGPQDKHDASGTASCLLGEHATQLVPSIATDLQHSNAQSTAQPCFPIEPRAALASHGVKLHATEAGQTSMRPGTCPAAASGEAVGEAVSSRTAAPDSEHVPGSRITDSSTDAERDCRHLQQLLLEAVAIGLVQTSHDIQHLLECTLVYTEMPYPVIHATTMRALFKLSK